MIVSVDIQAAIAQRAGVGRYVKCLAQNLGRYRADDALRLFYFDFKNNGMSFAAEGAEARAARWIPGRVVQKTWRTLNWPPYEWFAGAADLYHFTNFIRPPLARGKSVVSVYDVSFLRYPDAAEPGNLAYLTGHIERTVQQADAIITISEFSRREIVELLGASPDRVFSIHPGLDHERSRPDPDAIAHTRKTLGLERPYLLFVSTIEPRKNIPFLIDLFDQLDFFDGDLVIAGMQGWKVDPILQHMKSAKRSDRIRYVDYVPDELLPGLYAGAELFVFPSLYEGFGFPPLEAMACGTPVLSSAGGSLPEALGEAAHIVQGFEMEAWREAVRALLSNGTRRDELIARGLEQVKRYTWENVARGTWDTYRTVAR